MTCANLLLKKPESLPFHNNITNSLWSSHRCPRREICILTRVGGVYDAARHFSTLIREAHMHLFRVMAVVLLLVAAGTICAEEKKGDAGPRLGRYKIFSWGRVGTPPLYLGAVILEEGGKYKVLLNGDKPGGEGKYEYDAARKAVVWKEGPYKDDGFGGEFTIEREGKTHKIRLKKTTIATNNSDE
jgi:hypothetical protein